MNVLLSSRLVNHSDSQKFIINAFDIGEVQLAAGHEIRLRPGFESWRGSRFRARIEWMDICSLTRDEIKTLFSEPFPDNLNNAGLPNFETATNRCVIYPNPSDGVLNIETKKTSFGIQPIRSEFVC